MALVCWLIVFCLHVDLCVDEASDAEAAFMWAVPLTSGDLTQRVGTPIVTDTFSAFLFQPRGTYICFVSQISLPLVSYYIRRDPLTLISTYNGKFAGKKRPHAADAAAADAKTWRQQWKESVFALLYMHSILCQVRFHT